MALRSVSSSKAPGETAVGALLARITGGAEAETVWPMNVNFGLMPLIAGG